MILAVSFKGRWSSCSAGTAVEISRATKGPQPEKSNLQEFDKVVSKVVSKKENYYLRSSFQVLCQNTLNSHFKSPNCHDSIMQVHCQTFEPHLVVPTLEYSLSQINLVNRNV